MLGIFPLFLHCTSHRKISVFKCVFFCSCALYSNICWNNTKETQSNIKCMKCNILQNQANNNNKNFKFAMQKKWNEKNCIVYKLFICMLLVFLHILQKPAFYIAKLLHLFSNTQTLSCKHICELLALLEAI